jgi:hypothetical protein
MPNTTASAWEAVTARVISRLWEGTEVPADAVSVPSEGASAAGSTDEQQTASSGTPAPSASLMVTLAVSAAQAEAVVFGIEHGTLWLSAEPDGALVDGTDVITQGNIYGKAFA